LNWLKQLLKGQKKNDFQCEILMDFKEIGLTSIKYKDDSAYRRAIWHDYKNKFFFARVAEAFFDIRGLKKIMILIRAAASLISVSRYTEPNGNFKVWGICNYGNEFRALQRFQKDIGADYGLQDLLIIHFDKISLIKMLPVLFNIHHIIKFSAQDLKQLEASSFLISMRQIEFLIFFNYWNKYFSINPTPKLLVSSSESNPEIIGFTLAAKANGVTQLFVNHGSLASGLGLFFHDLYCLSNYDLQNKIADKCCNKNAQYFIIGQRDSEKKVLAFSAKSNLKILVIGSILNNYSKLAKIFQSYKIIFPDAELYFRPHPNEISTGSFKMEILNTCKVKVVANAITLKKQVQNYELILVGNSSAAQEAMEELIPSFYVEIDNAPYDVYGFMQRQFLPSGEFPENLKNSYEKIYLSKEWQETLEYFCPSAEKSDLATARLALSGLLQPQLHIVTQ
jgi:hypothetical protein